MSVSNSTAVESSEIKTRKKLLDYFMGNKEKLKHYVVRPHRTMPGYTLAYSVFDANGNSSLQYEDEDTNFSTTHFAAEECELRNMRERVNWLLEDHPAVVAAFFPVASDWSAPTILYKPPAPRAVEGTKLCELTVEQLKPGMDFRLVQADGTVLPAVLAEIITDASGTDVRFMTARGRARCSITDKEVEAYLGFNAA